MTSSESQHKHNHNHHSHAHHKHNHRGNTTLLALVFVLALTVLITIFYNLPPLTPEEYAQVKFPRSIQDVQALSNVLARYKQHHYYQVMTSFVGVYLFLQSFAIPGCLFLSILSGALFGLEVGLPLVSLVAACGASSCYTLSYFLARNLVKKLFPQMLFKFRNMIRQHRHNLFFYMLFLRATPLMPNWFVNVSSPLLGVPFHIFFFATFFGLIPANYLHVSTGLTLGELQSSASPYSALNARSIFTMIGIGCLALLPTLCRKRINQIDDALSDQARLEGDDLFTAEEIARLSGQISGASSSSSSSSSNDDKKSE